MTLKIEIKILVKTFLFNVKLNIFSIIVEKVEHFSIKFKIEFEIENRAFQSSIKHFVNYKKLLNIFQPKRGAF